MNLVEISGKMPPEPKVENVIIIIVIWALALLVVISLAPYDLKTWIIFGIATLITATFIFSYTYSKQIYSYLYQAPQLPQAPPELAAPPPKLDPPPLLPIRRTILTRPVPTASHQSPSIAPPTPLLDQ